MTKKKPELPDLAGAEEIDRALDGVTWSQPRAYEPGALAPSALFAGRGKTKAPLRWRLVETLARGDGPFAQALRAQVKSLLVDGDAAMTIDLAPLAAFPELRWLRVKHAAVIGAGALASVPRVELEDVAGVDLSALGDARFEDFSLVRTRFTGPLPHAASLRVVGFEGAISASTTKLKLMPFDEATTVGPIDCTASELEIYNAKGPRSITFGMLPNLESAHLSCLSSLESMPGIEQCASLRRLSFYLCGLRALPQLPAALESLSIEGDLEDASSLAVVPTLRRLRVIGGSVRVAASIAPMSELEHLALGRTPYDDVLPVLAKLPKLRSLELRGYSMERVPNLDVLAPQIETLSLEDCRGGFMEHDALHRMPNLRELRLAGSTLDMFKKQLDPRIKKRGVAVHFDRG